MVARVNTVAFQGINVQNVDVQVQTSNGLPAFTIVGYKNYLLLLAFLLAVFGSVSVHASEKSETDCPLFGAKYVPQNPVASDTYDDNRDHINRTLSFVLRIEKGDMCCRSTLRNIFLNFDAYKDGQRVSTMRFGDAWSNGVSQQSFSTYFGMYCNFGKDTESNCEEMKPSAGFVPIGVNENLMPAAIQQVPYLLIFPETYWELRYKSLQVPEHWDKYIKFYSGDRVYPDFRGYDFWVRQKCGDGGRE